MSWISNMFYGSDPLKITMGELVKSETSTDIVKYDDMHDNEDFKEMSTGLMIETDNIDNNRLLFTQHKYWNNTKEELLYDFNRQITNVISYFEDEEFKTDYHAIMVSDGTTLHQLLINTNIAFEVLQKIALKYENETFKLKKNINNMVDYHSHEKIVKELNHNINNILIEKKEAITEAKIENDAIATKMKILNDDNIVTEMKFRNYKSMYDIRAKTVNDLEVSVKNFSKNINKLHSVLKENKMISVNDYHLFQTSVIRFLEEFDLKIPSEYNIKNIFADNREDIKYSTLDIYKERIKYENLYLEEKELYLEEKELYLKSVSVINELRNKIKVLEKQKTENDNNKILNETQVKSYRENLESLKTLNQEKIELKNNKATLDDKIQKLENEVQSINYSKTLTDQTLKENKKEIENITIEKEKSKKEVSKLEEELNSLKIMKNLSDTLNKQMEEVKNTYEKELTAIKNNLQNENLKMQTEKDKMINSLEQKLKNQVSEKQTQEQNLIEKTYHDKLTSQETELMLLKKELETNNNLTKEQETKLNKMEFDLKEAMNSDKSPKWYQDLVTFLMKSNMISETTKYEYVEHMIISVIDDNYYENKDNVLTSTLDSFGTQIITHYPRDQYYKELPWYTKWKKLYEKYLGNHISINIQKLKNNLSILQDPVVLKSLAALSGLAGAGISSGVAIALVAGNVHNTTKPQSITKIPKDDNMMDQPASKRRKLDGI